MSGQEAKVCVCVSQVQLPSVSSQTRTMYVEVDGELGHIGKQILQSRATGHLTVTLTFDF